MLGTKLKDIDTYKRKSAIKYKIPYFTTTDAGSAAAKGSVKS